jgi:hypothetical protein
MIKQLQVLLLYIGNLPPTSSLIDEKQQGWHTAMNILFQILAVLMGINCLWGTVDLFFPLKWGGSAKCTSMDACLR